MKPSQVIAAALLVFSATAARADGTAVGLWRSFDDDTAEPTAEIRITEDARGELNGVIEKVIAPTPNSVCNLCTDDRKDRPILGLEIIRHEHHVDGKDQWEGGTILDPEDGKVYRARLTLLEGGKKLQVRGYIGPFYRTQTWIRVQEK